MLSGFIIAVAIQCGICIAISTVVAHLFNNMIINRLFSLGIFKLGFLQQSKIELNMGEFPDVVLLTNLVGIKITAGLGSLNGSVFFHMKLFSILAVPLFSFIVGGYLTSKINYMYTWTEVIWAGIGIGVLNSLFLATMSVTGGSTASIPIPFIKESIDITSRFSLIEALYHGFVFGCIFSLIGAWIHRGRIQMKKMDTHFQ